MGYYINLKSISIDKNTLKLYEMVPTADKRKTLSDNTGIDKDDILKLTKSTDLII